MWMAMVLGVARAGELDVDFTVGDDTVTLQVDGVVACGEQVLRVEDAGGKWEVRVVAAATDDGRVWTRSSLLRSAADRRVEAEPALLAQPDEAALFSMGDVRIEVVARGFEPEGDRDCLPPALRPLRR